MARIAFGSWELSTEHAASSHGHPVLVCRVTGEACGPRDVVECYPSWGYLPAGRAVARLARMRDLSAAECSLVEIFVGALN